MKRNRAARLRCSARGVSLTPLTLLFTAAVLLILPVLTARGAEPQSPSRWEETIAGFEQLDRETPPQPGGVLFLGSSSIRMWDTAQSFPGRRTVNRGFGGSQIPDVRQYADRIAWIHRPAAIVFYAGDNDLAAGKPVAQVVEDFRGFAAEVQRQLPECQLIYLPIKPSLKRWELWPQMAEANAQIKSWVEQQENMHYVDTATPMLGDDRQPQPQLFAKDGLHLNQEGYALWSGILQKELAGILPGPASQDKPPQAQAP